MSGVRLSHKMVLERAERVADGAGGFTEAWVPVGTLWAALKPGSGRERFGAGVTRSSVPWKITVRAAPVGQVARPRADQRLREGTRIFRITAVAEQDTHARYLTCFALEEAAG